MSIERKIILHFSAEKADKPLVNKLIRDYNLELNFLHASMENGVGTMVVGVVGSSEDYDKGMGYLAKVGVAVEDISRGIYRNEDRCTGCGACIGFCPSGAFTLDKQTANTVFNSNRCISCGVCVKACLSRCMHRKF
ncbi:MAG: 4Fe-4S binding protein [Chloroflexi bacterium]|nr:4Fe-4S binding protein [Chloroflexota bacterium]